jgi:hypothetical protein
MNTKEIKFSAISYNRPTELLKKKKHHRVMGMITSVALLFMLPLLFDNNTEESIIWSWSVFVVLGWVITMAAYMNDQIVQEKKKVWRRFASANGWKMNVTEDVALPNGVNSVAIISDVNNVVSGELQGNEFRLYDLDYYFTNAEGIELLKELGLNVHKNLTVLSIKLSKKYPPILLDSKNNKGGAIQVLKDSEKISLEGDFDEHFQLFCLPEYRIETLSLITPDVMQTAMHANKQYDIEIFGNTLFIYTEQDRLNKKYIKDLFQGAEKLLLEVKHKSKSFRNEWIQNSDYKPADYKYIKLTNTRHYDIKDIRIVTLVLVAVVVALASSILAKILIFSFF